MQSTPVTRQTSLITKTVSGSAPKGHVVKEPSRIVKPTKCDRAGGMADNVLRPTRTVHDC